jgi:hypothetical protein
MREVKDTLARPRAGGISETGAEIRRVMTLDEGGPGAVTPTEAAQMRMLGSLAERYDYYTSLEVTAAWIGPDLTDEAYWTTYGAVTGPRKELR